MLSKTIFNDQVVENDTTLLKNGHIMMEKSMIKALQIEVVTIACNEGAMSVTTTRIHVLWFFFWNLNHLL